MLKLKLQHDVKSQLIGKTLMLGKTEGRRRRGQQIVRRFDGLTKSMGMRFFVLFFNGHEFEQAPGDS